MEYHFQFEEDRCTGCFACHTACISTHFDYWEDAKSFRTIQCIVNKEEGFQKNICPGCIHCGACMRACPKQAVFKDEETGFILVNQDKCNGCRMCEASCPLHVIQFDKEGKMIKCDGCIGFIKKGEEPFCVRNCYANAIVLKER